MQLSRLASLKRFAPVIWTAVALLAVYVLATRLHTLQLSDIRASLSLLSPVMLAIAVACCVVAYLILSAYEVMALRAVTGRALLRTGFITSWIAHSIGHIVGAALVSGGALRYRRYARSGLSVAQVSAVTVSAAMPYVLGFGWWLDVTLLFYSDDAARALHLDERIVIALAIVGFAKDIAWLVLVARRRALQIGPWRLSLPTMPMTLLQISVGMAEIVLVAGVMYVLMPAELGMGLVAFTGMFLIAVTAAQISHVPAGIGVLEAALLLLLPQVPSGKLLGAILAYRAIFELFPLAIGLALLGHEELRDKLRRPFTETALPDQSANNDHAIS